MSDIRVPVFSESQWELLQKSPCMLVGVYDSFRDESVRVLIAGRCFLTDLRGSHILHPLDGNRHFIRWTTKSVNLEAFEKFRDRGFLPGQMLYLTDAVWLKDCGGFTAVSGNFSPL